MIPSGLTLWCLVKVEYFLVRDDILTTARRLWWLRQSQDSLDQVHEPVNRGCSYGYDVRVCVHRSECVCVSFCERLYLYCVSQNRKMSALPHWKWYYYYMVFLNASPFFLTSGASPFSDEQEQEHRCQLNETLDKFIWISRQTLFFHDKSKQERPSYITSQ
jgi:hypothetical protein